MKIIVNVSVPSIAEKYDVLVPVFLSVKEVAALIADAVVYLSGRRYTVSGCELICLVEQNLLLREDRTLADYDVKNGDHLVMM